MLAGDQAATADLDAGQVAAAHLVVQQVAGEARQAGGLIDGVGQPTAVRVLGPPGAWHGGFWRRSLTQSRSSATTTGQLLEQPTQTGIAGKPGAPVSTRSLSRAAPRSGPRCGCCLVAWPDGAALRTAALAVTLPG